MIDWWGLFEPWVWLILLLVPLFYTERWIHRHFFGVGYLLSEDKRIATQVFYLFFLPGIFVHEFIQYLVAGVLNVPIKRLVAWPQAQDNGTLRLDFVMVEHDKLTARIDPIRSALVAASPFVVMAGIVWFLSTQMLDLHEIAEAIGAGSFSGIGKAIGRLFDKPDFLIWLYLLFTVANTMIPKREDAHGWPIILGLAAIILFILAVIGLDRVMLETLGGPVAETIRLIDTALLAILLLNLAAIGLLWGVEELVSGWRGFRMDYGGPPPAEAPAAKRIAGSDVPYPKGQPIPSIYALDLPLPDPDKIPRRARPAATPPPARPASASLTRETTSQARPPAQDEVVFDDVSEEDDDFNQDTDTEE